MNEKALDQANNLYLIWTLARDAGNFKLASVCKNQWERSMNQVFIPKGGQAL